MPLGRRFRALKLWAVLRCYGREGLQAVIREHVRLAQLFESWVREEPGWTIEAPRPFSLVCFRLDATDEENEELLRRVNATRRGVPLAHAPARPLRAPARDRQRPHHRGRRAARLGRSAARGGRPVGDYAARSQNADARSVRPPSAGRHDPALDHHPASSSAARARCTAAGARARRRQIERRDVPVARRVQHRRVQRETRRPDTADAVVLDAEDRSAPLCRP